VKLTPAVIEFKTKRGTFKINVDMNMYDSHTFCLSEIDLFYDINMIICINEH